MTDPSLNERLAEEPYYTSERAELNRPIRELAGRDLCKALYEALGGELCGCGNPACDLAGGKGDYGPVPDYLTYPGMGAVLEAMREQSPHIQWKFADRVCLLAGHEKLLQNALAPWILWMTPELVAEAAVEALEGEADG
jgi:hypothetical protein